MEYLSENMTAELMNFLQQNKELRKKPKTEWKIMCVFELHLPRVV